nr:MAG TPA: Minor capsid protein [Caudoviricetes sp.]
MKVKINIKLNQANIKEIEQAAIKALPLTMEAMKTEVNNMQVVPKETGALEESVSTGAEGETGYISYNTPYGRRLYYHPEYNFRQDKNPNAQGRWMDSFIYGEKKNWLEKTYGKNLKDNAGGVIK